MDNTELNVIERVSRIVIGTGLIVFTLAVNIAPLGLLALLPLLATYPISQVYMDMTLSADGLVKNLLR